MWRRGHPSQRRRHDRRRRSSRPSWPGRQDLTTRADEAFLGPICSGLAEVGIRFSSWSQLDDDDRTWLTDEFQRRIFPVLTPLAVDPGHPFPYISTLSLNLAVIVGDPSSGERRFARVKVPSLLQRFVALPDGERFVPLEQVIAAHLDQLFPGMDVIDSVTFRVTRNADLTVEDEEADDLLAAIEMELRRRRFGKAVRLEVEDDISAVSLELIRTELELRDDDVFAHAAPVDLSGLFAVHDVDRPELKYPDFVPVTQRRLNHDEDEDVQEIFGAIAAGDILVHHPYDSFVTSVEEFIHQAAMDPKVLTIKLTLYRTSGDSPIVGSLIRAAEQGKQVAALVELKARFDEERNIEWARRLEQAGVHVVYGLVGLKTHTKTCMVVRDEGAGVRRYCHIGTGNYNSKTARLYEDVGLLTVDPEIGADLSQLFNYLTGYARDVDYRKLLVAPHSLRDGLTRADPPGARGAPRVGPHHHEDEQPGRRRDDRRALRRIGGRRQGRPDRAGHLLSARRCAGPVGQHHGAQRRRPLPGALADLPFRQRRRAPALRSTSWAQPTSCRATWIAGSRRWSRSRTSTSASASTRSWRSASRTTRLRGVSTTTGGAGTRQPPWRHTLSCSSRRSSVPRSIAVRFDRGAWCVAAGRVRWSRARRRRPVEVWWSVHRPRYDDWWLPKGKPDPDERHEDTRRARSTRKPGLRCRSGRESTRCAT